MQSFLDSLTPHEDAILHDATDASDACRFVPYLLRFYVSVSNPRAECLTEGIMDTLIGHIAWPRGALTRIGPTMSRLRRAGRTDHKFSKSFSDIHADSDSVEAVATPIHRIDRTLAEFGNFKLALQQLYIDEPEWLRSVLRNSMPAAEAMQNEADGAIWNRLQSVGAVFGWSLSELQLARLALHTEDIPPFAEWIETLLRTNDDHGPRALRRVFNSSVVLLQQSLQPRSALVHSGLYLVERYSNKPSGLHRPPRLHTKLLAALGQTDFNVAQLSELLFSKSPGSTLASADFSHLQDESAPLDALLRRASESRERGIHILIYGPPGTGKTEFARWLVSHADLRAYEVPVIDDEEEDDSTRPVSDRLALLRSAYWLMGTATQTALIFDEAEDAFPHDMPLWMGGVGVKDVAHGPRKGWVNQLLEESPLPTIWISNAVHQMDAAYLRRFTYHLEMRRPSQRVRERIAGRRAVLHGLPTSLAAPLGAFADASPAMIDSALRFARLASNDDNPATRITTQTELATRSLRAGLQAAGLTVNGDARIHQTTYNPSFINLHGGVDATALLASLQRTRASNICFYGAPGTGKTSFAEHIARELDRPLMIRRASDLQSKWVGETEKRMRESFNDAQSENAVLLLDEADSFLGDRNGAHHSWERSQVNELLQCMERFEGIFIAATNLIDTLDKAALRRFTHKIEFLPLTLEQRIAMFRQQLGEVELPDIRWAHLRTKLARLDGLTAGDFGVVARQANMRLDAMTADEMIAALGTELQLRSPLRGRAMGFA